MRRLLSVSILFAGALLLGGACASTKVVSTWRSPEVTGPQVSRLLVVVPTRDGALRRKAEEELVKRLPVPAVPSYTFIRDADIADLHTYEPEIMRRGCDGILVFRVVSVAKEQRWIPGMYAGHGYASGAWPVYNPGYVDTDTTVRVDTNLYSLPDRKLVGASTSESWEPTSDRDLTDDVADVVIKKMKKDAVLPRE